MSRLDPPCFGFDLKKFIAPQVAAFLDKLKDESLMDDEFGCVSPISFGSIVDNPS